MPLDDKLKAEEPSCNYSSEQLASLESILCTDELHKRPARAPDYEAENHALLALAQALAASPGTILQTLSDCVLVLLKADSAGLSLLAPDKKRFYWPTIAGMWGTHAGGGTPREFGPCGDVLDSNAPMLFKRFERRYPYLLEATPLAEECLLAPFYVDGQAVGTIWAIAHDTQRQFDAEDLRLLQSLGKFASAAYQATESINTEKEFNRSIIDSSPDCIKLLDLDGNLLAVLSGQTLLGIEDIKPFLNKPWINFWEGGDKQAARTAIDAAAAGGQGRFVGFLRSRRDEVKSWDVAISPILDNKGKPSSLLAVSRDISDWMRSQQELSKAVDELARLDRRKDEFLAMLSHELRNPLAPIANALKILQMQNNESPIQLRARAVIERQANNLTHLVDDLLEVSRIRTGRIKLRLEKIAVNGIVDRAVETARPQIVQGRHELTVTMPPVPLLLNADAARLEQVVVNLLTNAAKYTKDGGRIWLSVEPEGETAVLRVRDSGIGIAPELLPHIFDLFTQAERSLDRAQGGLGIGLCLVERLVHLHGGHVEASSVVGEGSEFVVRLPMITSTPMPAMVNQHVKTTPIALNCKVMVVDDNRDAAQSLGTLLELREFDVRLAFDGPDALKVAYEYLPDVIVLDIGLPGLNGYEVASHIRQHPALSGVVLIALTGYGLETDRQRSFEAGFDHHLVKPADFTEVQKLLANIMANTLSQQH